MSQEPPFEILPGFWHDLKPHAERGAVFVVSQDLELMEVAMAVRDDVVDKVQGWLASGALARPSTEKLAALDANPTIEMSFVIVQPYVLIQQKGH